MVDFRAELRPASFRGIAFFVADDDGAGGRRIVTHEYPGRDDPFHEDLGESIRSFNVQAVVIGSGYVANAAALEAAFLQKGTGTLLHPHHGELQVVAKDMRRQHSNTRIGEVVFNVTFERAGASSGALAFSDTARNLSLASDSMFSLASMDFNASILAGLFPAYVDQDGVSRLNSLLSFARQTFQNGGLDDLFGITEFASFDSGTGDEVVSLFQGVASSVKPQASPVIGGLATPQTTVQPLPLIRVLATVAGNDADTAILPTSPSRAAMIGNASAISTVFKTSALAAAGSAARYAEYDSREQAIATRDTMTGALDALRNRQLIAGSIDGWRATSGLLVAVTQDINDRIGRLPRTVQVKSAAVRPSLALANRLYGDDTTTIFARADDIVSRNRVAHPGFVSTGPLEVLINA